MNNNLEIVARAICKNYSYEYVGLAGQGTFKETYQIINNGICEALKVFRPGLLSHRNTREIEAMIRCDHPNIGKLRHISTFSFKGHDYLITFEEFYSGGTLTGLIQKGLIPKQQFHSLGSQLISAIEHIAEKDLVHRDIKPDNVIFREDGLTAMIVDFGLVRNLTEQSLTQTWLLQGPGTPFYAAPEQLNNQKDLIDWRTDQFALGVVFSLCCFGVHPYAQDGDSNVDIVARVIQRESINRDLASKAHDLGLDIILKMVGQWPVQRYRRPADLCKAWEVVLSRGGE